MSMRDELIHVPTGFQVEPRLFSGFLAGATLLLLCVIMASSAMAQPSFLTSRGDTTRSGANTNETILTPSNVNTGSFGHLFSVPLDYQALAQPLYVPNVNIGGQIHNVVYVVTQTDSAYAIDADNGGAPLWHASLLDGGVPATGAYLPCGTLGGFNQEGIVGTPVIDPNTNTMYVVAKSVANATVRHFLHVLDITTGLDVAPPVQIAASSVSMKGTNTVFNSLHQKNRPGALLLGTTLYLGFGSNGCNDHNSGWVLAYDVTNQQSIHQIGVFNTSPDSGLTSIWQTGNGLAADEFGNLFIATAESSNYDVPAGGQSYSNSLLKLSPAPWTSSPSQPQLADYFTPSEVAFLNAHDLDVSSVGPVVLPDLSGPYPHEVIGSSKQGLVWVLNRDDMGWYSPVSDNVIQEFSLTVNGELMCSPAYWNGMVYFIPDGSPIQSFQVSNGLWTPLAQSPKKMLGASSPAISSNGNTNGILWALNGTLDAFDAVTLNSLYISTAKVPKLAHFATPTVINGKVYVATQNSLEAYGLLNVLTVASGSNQVAQVGQPLPQPIQIVATNPYNGQPQPGVTVTFSDGGKGGSFNPTTAVTDSNGSASTVYTVPSASGVFTLTLTAPNFANVTTTATASASAATRLILISGNRQTGSSGSLLPSPLVVEAKDAHNNPVVGITVQFKPGTQGVVNPASAVTNSKGLAQTSFQLGTIVGSFTVSASSGAAKGIAFSETSVVGAPALVTVTGGNNQTQPAKTTLRKALTVVVTDQYGNKISGVGVTFSDNGAGGNFSNVNPVVTDSSGIAAQSYTLPAVDGTINITATAAGITNPATFTELAE